MPLFPTWWEEIKHFWNDEVELKESILSMALFKDENGRIGFGGIMISYVLPIGTAYVFYLLMNASFNDNEDTALKTKILN